MMNEAAVGFWSYAREDDVLDGGNILQLSRLIMEEYNLLSGEPLNLFVDSNDIAWGQQWRERIDSSLAETTFFIPIITPRYFTRPECRRELLEFAAKAKMLGVEELLLPILYIEMRDLSTENPDEAIALVARTQYVDWHANRLLDARSQEYRIAVNALVQRLLDIGRSVAEIQFQHALNLEIDNADADADGITDIVSQIEPLLPDWLEVVMTEKSARAQALGLKDHYDEQLRKLRKRRAPASALLSAQIRYAREILPLCERGLKDSQIYLARSIELDPLVSALARLVAEHPDSLPLAAQVKEAIDRRWKKFGARGQQAKVQWSMTFDRWATSDGYFNNVISFLMPGYETLMQGMTSFGAGKRNCVAITIMDRNIHYQRSRHLRQCSAKYLSLTVSVLRRLTTDVMDLVMRPNDWAHSSEVRRAHIGPGLFAPP
jgi:hypothetical protein